MNLSSNTNNKVIQMDFTGNTVRSVKQAAVTPDISCMIFASHLLTFQFSRKCFPTFLGIRGKTFLLFNSLVSRMSR